MHKKFSSLAWQQSGNKLQRQCMHEVLRDQGWPIHLSAKIKDTVELVNNCECRPKTVK